MQLCFPISKLNGTNILKLFWFNNCVLSCWNRSQLQENTVFMKAILLRQMAKVRSQWLPSKKNYPSIMWPPPAWLLALLKPDTMGSQGKQTESNVSASDRAITEQWKVSDLLPMFYDQVPMLPNPLLVVWIVDGGYHGHLEFLGLYSPIYSKLQYTVYSNSFLLEPGPTFSAV